MQIKYFVILFISCLTTFSFLSSSGKSAYESLFENDSSQWFSAAAAIDAFLIRDISFSAEIDTIIKGKEYHFSRNYGIFLSEDTLSGKIWIHVPGDTIDYLIMDLGLEEGDTFKTTWFFDYPFFIVDSVYYDQGRKHVRFADRGNLFIHEINQLVFIEGVGTNLGLLYLIPPFYREQSHLLCFYVDGQRIYEDSSVFKECQIITTTVPKHDYQKQNPFTIRNYGSILQIQFDSEIRNGFLQIIGLDGRILSTRKVISSGEYIETKLNTGYYIISYYDVKEKISYKSQRIIVP